MVISLATRTASEKHDLSRARRHADRATRQLRHRCRARTIAIRTIGRQWSLGDGSRFPSIFEAGPRRRDFRWRFRKFVTSIEQLAQGPDQDVLDLRRHARRRAGFVAALRVGYAQCRCSLVNSRRRRPSPRNDRDAAAARRAGTPRTARPACAGCKQGPRRNSVKSIVCPWHFRRAQARLRAEAKVGCAANSFASLFSSSHGATGSATGRTRQLTSVALIGALWAAEIACAAAMPSARRRARAGRFSGKPSLYFPAVTFPAAPLKCTKKVPGWASSRSRRAMPTKSQLTPPFP